MKITFIAPTLSFAGGIRVIATYAQLLQDRGHEVLVVSTPPEPPTLRVQLSALLQGKEANKTPKHFPSYFDQTSVRCQVLDRYRPITEEDVPDADIVIATWWETAEWVSHFSARKGIKVYFIQHHEVFDYLPRARVEATYRLPFHKVVVAPWLVDVMQANYDDEPLAIAPPGVDTKLFFAPPRHKQVLPTVGLMYSPLYWKGCDLCLEAFRLASRWIPELRLIVFGEVFPPIECPLPENSQFFHRPSQHELRCIYASCDAWLFGSRSEGFGLPLLEAMACRTPIIGTPTGAAPDLLKEGGGLLVDSGDPTAIAHAIAHMCQLSDAEWQGYSNAAYEKATSYTWQDATNRFEAALIEATRQS